MTRILNFIVLSAAGVLAAVAVACSGGEASAPNAATSTATGSSPAIAAATATAPATGTAVIGGTVTKVSANNASVAELTAAFQAAGIPNASRWAREVEEYRPYPANDPSWGKLRQELAKYNPSPGVVDAIIATLQP